MHKKSVKIAFLHHSLTLRKRLCVNLLFISHSISNELHQIIKRYFEEGD